MGGGEDAERRADRSEEQLGAEGVPLRLLLCERLGERRESGAKALRINKRQNGNRLPDELFAVEIVLEVDRVEVNDGRGGVHHQSAVRFWEGVAGCRREDCHQLLKRREGRADAELSAGKVVQVDEVRGARRVVERVEPAPICGGV